MCSSDLADFRLLIRELLEADGWRVWDADGGEQGIDLAREHRPSVVLCDLLMPRGNGFQVCRALRSDPRFHATRIIVTSGRAYESDRNAALEAGADEYLVKPFDLAALVARLRAGAADASFATQTISARDANRGNGGWLKFWGVRGSIATPGPETVHYGGNTSCVEIRAAGQIIILDAGTGLRQLGRELVREFQGQPIDRKSTRLNSSHRT